MSVLTRLLFLAAIMAWPLAGFSQGQAITYTQHIAPILQANCVPCHKPSGAAPFSLLTYRDAARRAKTIQVVTQARYMPPWKADSHYRSFANERRLTDGQIELIKKWAANGAPQGAVAKTTALAHAETKAPKPDLVLRPKEAYRIRGNNTENFVMFKIPVDLPADQPVRAIEFVPGNRRLLHHANYAIQAVDANTDIYRGSDYVLSDQFLTNLGEFQPLMADLVYYGGWIPGSSMQEFPSGVGFALPRRGVILLTVHYGGSAVDTSDWSAINVYFAAQPVKRVVQAVSIGSGGIGEITPPLIIPADSVKRFEVKLRTSTDLSLLYAWPHMHLLGKSYKAWATLPSGEDVPLVRIPAWDFRWQESYRFKQMLYLPKGSVITVQGVYDNTRKNPNNPFNPPQMIISGGLMESRSEMLNLILLFLPYQQGDERVTL
ncbi:cytochrome c [Hymenobacter busanensis]|uniref:Cytochrome c n=1 Tax=Hymenobacter busanensis TaxID=2607656 RepID=A0A7L5A2C7_9BACT|nr:cytochrome c [Hymenobacter busanensis]KAA9338310.1 cytochrome c [Hymenobacter busanensis]QHJ09266.1 cytochrome c [Hymenobacter busanensis]